MKILMISTPVTGHINPLLAIGRMSMAEDHELVGLSGTWLRDRIVVSGARFRALAAEADTHLRDIPSIKPFMVRIYLVKNSIRIIFDAYLTKIFSIIYQSLKFSRHSHSCHELADFRGQKHPCRACSAWRGPIATRIITMTFPIKMLPALALAIALSPFAAQAQTAHQPAHAQASVDEVMVGSATIDSPTHVYSNNFFPDSFGG